ncbi:AAEL009720-PA, partial [Aedes aegypti]
QCNLCSKSFKNKANLWEHNRLHKGNLPFPCKDCGTAFSRTKSLETHRKNRDHPIGSIMSCPFCPKTFKSRQTIRMHILNHQGKLPFKCEDCDARFDRKFYLQKHRERYHQGDSGQPNFGCLQCGMQFRSADKLRAHTSTHHLKKEVKPTTVAGKGPNPRPIRQGLNVRRPFKCQYCPKSFSRKYIMMEHTFIHTGSLRYPCDICMAMFNRPHYLKAHKLKYHSENSTFKAIKCRFCTRTFVRQQDIKMHERVFETSQNGSLDESGGKGAGEDGSAAGGGTTKLPYTIDEDPNGEAETESQRIDTPRLNMSITLHRCPKCHKVFKTLRSLKHHMIYHQSQLPFACDECGVQFARNRPLQIHKERYHSEDAPYKGERFSCDFCPRIFLRDRDKLPYKLCRCTICASMFKNRDNWEDHLQNHPNVRPHHCEKCLIKRKSRSNRKVTSVGFKCQHCPKVFTKANTLRGHARLHNSELRFPCDECGMMYDRYRLLQAHKDKYHS